MKRFSTAGIRLVALLLVIAGLTFTAASSSNASAAPTVVQGATSYLCPWPKSSQCAPQYYFKANAAVTMRCWSDEQVFYGRYVSGRWFIVDVAGHGTWIHSSWVNNQVAVPHC